jgi:alpha-beta hydrolase superfamily lysophospholipase
VTDRPRSLPARLLRWALGLVVLAAGLGLGALFTYAYVTAPGSTIELWHSYVPDELSVAEIDATDWPGYIAAENRARTEVAANVTAKLPPDERQRFNRFNAESPVNPARFVQDWNRSYVLEPQGPAQGVVVLLHGLTDAPYSLRHIAELYQSHGWIAIGLRIPGHGTVPGALTKATWQQWAAATRLAMREAKRRAGSGLPIDLIGYSNGGALAVNYQLEALSNPALPGARRIVLMSPMIGLTEFARFAGVAGWPAIIPAFSHSAWMGIVPEFNPYKYNSFPVNAARESFRLTDALQTGIDAAVASGALKRMPPVLTFQSVADGTVSTSAIITRLYDRLPANGSELVLFDINRRAGLEPLLRRGAGAPVAALVPPKTRAWRLTVITNTPESDEAFEVTTPPASTAPSRRDTGLVYPADVFSLTHIAIPFPASDGLYGNTPNPADDTGINLGGLAARGERGVLSIGLDTLLRLSWNPFYPWMADKVAAGIAPAPNR